MSKTGITVIGSLNMDIVVTMNRLPKLGETVIGEGVSYIPGGKGANQALACSRLTADTKLIGCVGSDTFGDMIRKQMADNGVSLEAIETIDGETTGTAHISHTEGDNCIVVVAGANSRCTEDYIKLHENVIRTAAVAVAQLEIPLPTVQTAFQIAKKAGVITVLNPAPACKLPEELLRLTDFITPNETEWELINGKPCHDDNDFENTINVWEANHGAKVIVTRGGKGCSYIVDGCLVTVPAPNVQVIDTTGAGDAFNAAFAYGLSKSNPINEIMQFAVNAASLSVQKFGAQGGMPTLEEVLLV